MESEQKTNFKMVDVRKPVAAPLARSVVAPRSATLVRKKHGVLFFSSCIVALIGIVGIFYVIKVIELKDAALRSKDIIAGKVSEAANALQNFDISKAALAFTDVNKELETLKAQAQQVGIFKLMSIGGSLSPLLKNTPDALNDFIGLSGAALAFTNNLNNLQTNAFTLMFNGKGALVLDQLRGLQENLGIISALGTRLKTYAASANMALPGDYLGLLVDLYSNQSLLQGLIGFLDSKETTHLALLFQNPSEIRPAGGFIGSYADLAIQNGSITGIDVRDIYDPDGQLPDKTLPPRPLQAITGTWGSRDANWFFDFPTSAEKVLHFLDKSKIYSEQNITFGGAIAVNVNLVKDILNIVGPIELPEYQKTITGENFLESVQAEVESGEDKRAGEPKRILKVLTPMLLDKLAHLDDAQKRGVVGALKARVAAKDILAYFRDRALEMYMQNSGLGGEIYMPAEKSAEDYLAVVNANIAGGKTDAFMKQTVTLKSIVGLDGKVTDNLAIERDHEDANRAEWWYRAPNKDFLQIFTPAETTLTTMTGHDKKIPDPPLNRPTYLRDNDVEAIERSYQWLPDLKVQRHSQFGKTTYSAWLTVPVGETKKITAEYELGRSIILAPDVNYRFVYEKQSGVDAALHYSVEAPPGFVWKENGATTFSYENDNPESRVVLDLTLEKL